MAKVGQGIPYLVQAAMDDDRPAFGYVQDAYTSLSADISKLINTYFSEDWPLIVVALTAAAASLKAELAPGGAELVDALLEDAQAIHYKTPKKDAGGYESCLVQILGQYA